MLEISSKKLESVMSSATWNEAEEIEAEKREAASMLRALASLVKLSGGNAKSAWAAVARMTGLRERRVRSFWYLEATPNVAEMKRLRRVVDARMGAEDDTTRSKNLERRLFEIEERVNALVAELEGGVSDAQG